MSIVGPPGCGKSLLARHATRAHANTAWVDARHLRSLDGVLMGCLAALEAEMAPGDTLVGALSRALDGRDCLVVLDGLDLDATAAGPAITDMLGSTMDARIVVTSLAGAGDPAERVVRIGPLPVPTPRSPLSGPAVDLFLDRVRAAGGHPVDLDTQSVDVRRLLVATGGLPLLIEQMAVQCALVGLGNAVAADTLAQAVNSAYELLDRDQRRLLRRMSLLDVAVGPAVLAAVSGGTVAQTTSLLGTLVRRSLVEVLPDGRFDMLSPIRSQVRTLAAAESDDPSEAPGSDAEHIVRGLLIWAEQVAPQHDNFGAADAAWLTDLPAMRSAVLLACERDGTRAEGYSIANRIFSSLYTSMRAREALEVLEAALESGDGPPAIGAQVARRAGIAASEVRGTYEGLWLLDRADEHAAHAELPDEQLAKTASIRAEMHLDAGDLRAAESEARRAIDLDPHGAVTRQALRTLADSYVSWGRFAEASAVANEAMPGTHPNDERWIALSARTLLARIALEQGRVTEATAATKAVVAEATELAEDRVCLLAETMLRGLDPSWRCRDVNKESLPWAVRLPVLAQDARELFAAGDAKRAAGLAADVVALADSARLGRDAVEARLLLGRALLAQGDHEQAATTFLHALEQAAQMPMPLRAADAIDGLASVTQARAQRDARGLAAVAAAIRAPRLAAAWGYAARFKVEPARTPPDGWLDGADLAPEAPALAAAMFHGATSGAPSPLDALTAAERQVAERVATGLTSRQIGEELFVSPRTVDAHLTHIYRKLGINTRAKLAVLVTSEG